MIRFELQREMERNDLRRRYKKRVVPKIGDEIFFTSPFALVIVLLCLSESFVSISFVLQYLLLFPSMVYASR